MAIQYYTQKVVFFIIAGAQMKLTQYLHRILQNVWFLSLKHQIDRKAHWLQVLPVLLFMPVVGNVRRSRTSATTSCRYIFHLYYENALKTLLFTLSQIY